MTVNSQPDYNPANYTYLAAMVDAAPLLIACIGPDLRFRQVNAEYERVYQRPREWFAGRKLVQALPAGIYREILPRLELALLGVAVDFEYEGNFTPLEPAQVRYLRARYTPNIVNGRQDGIVVVIEDITRYRSVARALDTSQEQLKEIVDHVPVFIAYFSADLRYKFVNAAYERWYGKPRQWFVGRTIREVMGPENFERVESQMRQVMGGKTVQFVFERRAPNGDCTHVLEAHLVPDFDADGVCGIYSLVTDDTQRRVAQDAALRAQWEMRAVADNLPALITYVDADLRYRYVNASFLAWYRQPPQYFIGRRVENLVGSVFALTGPLLRRALQGESLDFEYARRNDNFVDPDRVLRVQLLPDTVAGITRGFIALIDDITDARRAENVLRRAEQELRAVIDTIPALVATFDMQARFIYVNRSFAEWCGRPESWFPGRRAAAVMAPALAALVMPTIRRVLAGEHVTIEPQCALIRPRDGAERYCRAQYVPLMDGQVQRGFVGTAQDVTEWREINRTLRQQEIRLRQIADASSEAFALSDLQRRTISYASPAFGRIFGLAGGSLEGRGLSWLMLVHPDDRLQIGERFAQTLQRGGFSAEYRITRPNGEIRWVHDQADLVRNDDGAAIGLASVIGDITDRKRIAELQHLKDAAEGANRTKTEFLSKMSHELRTPLNAILGFSQLMHYDHEHPLDAQQRESVDEILTAGHHLLNIVDEMLDLTRIEIGKLKVTLVPTDLRDICTECLAMVHSEARQRDIEISFANESRRHSWALADRTRARQIVLNLLSNAIKYNLPHGAVNISIDSRATPGYLRILVADNGLGLSAEQIGKLFVPFQRLDAERISVEGLGLGLALSKQLAEAMGGALGAHGTVGKGCTFWLDLPVADKA